MTIHEDSTDREILREICMYLAVALAFFFTLYFGLLLIGVIQWPGQG